MKDINIMKMKQKSDNMLQMFVMEYNFIKQLNQMKCLNLPNQKNRHQKLIMQNKFQERRNQKNNLFPLIYNNRYINRNLFAIKQHQENNNNLHLHQWKNIKHNKLLSILISQFKAMQMAIKLIKANLICLGLD